MLFSLSTKFNFSRNLQNRFASNIATYLYVQTPDYHESVYAISKVFVDPYKFVIITSIPSALNTLEAFTSPFDTFTWILIAGNCISFSFFITLDHLILHSVKIGTRKKSHLLDSISNMIFPLIGQVSDSTIKSFHCKKGGRLVWILWLLFGSYILMNNLYQGSVYSYLTVILPPPVPKTMTQLRHSPAPIVTTHAVYRMDSNEVKVDSVLIRYLIPEMVGFLGKNSSYSRLLSDLNQRTVHITTANFLNMVMSWVNKSLPEDPMMPFKTNIFPIQDTFAIFDSMPALQVTVQLLAALGRRYIVSNSEDTMINQNMIWAASRNFLQPTIHRHIRQLEESGLPERWKTLNMFSMNWYFVSFLGNETSAGWFRKKMSEAKEQDVWHESNAMTLKVLTFVFVLWGAMLALGGFLLGLEVIKGKRVLCRGSSQLYRKIGAFLWLKLTRSRQTNVIPIE